MATRTRNAIPRPRELRFVSGLQDERFGASPITWRDAPHIVLRMTLMLGLVAVILFVCGQAGMAIADPDYVSYGVLLTALVVMGLRSDLMGVATPAARVIAASFLLAPLAWLHGLALLPLLDDPTAGWAGPYHVGIVGG